MYYQLPSENLETLYDIPVFFLGELINFNVTICQFHLDMVKE
jgi:hypothetical protein